MTDIVANLQRDFPKAGGQLLFLAVIGGCLLFRLVRMVRRGYTITRGGEHYRKDGSWIYWIDLSTSAFAVLLLLIIAPASIISAVLNGTFRP